MAIPKSGIYFQLKFANMPGYCCIIGCSGASHDRAGNKIGLRLFSFPTVKMKQSTKVQEITRRRRVAWVAAVRRPEITFDNIPSWRLVCSRHFHQGVPSYEMFETHPDWAPSLNLGHTEVKGTNSDRYLRREKRTKIPVTTKKNVASSTVQVEPEDNLPEAGSDDFNQSENMAPGTTIQTDLTGDDIFAMQNKICELQAQVDSMGQEINRLLEEVRNQKEILNKRTLTQDSLETDEEKVRYLTGLPSYATFLILLNFLTPHLRQRSCFTPFLMLLITLMRLRLNIPQQFLAYYFNVCSQTIRNTFMHTVSVMYARLSPLVNWPDRESLRKTMPHQFFEIFGNRVAIIIDCFEVFIERSANLKARAQTFSHYKHQHTMKYLIGITPRGAISYISVGWGGRASDKHITENSGFLDKLLPGDVVLADRGFDISESVGIMCAEIKMPAFTKGRAQMHARDIEATRKLAHLRIHVERVIGTLRGKYSILSETLPINLVLPCDGEKFNFLDKIVTVCCALTNMCPSVV